MADEKDTPSSLPKIKKFKCHTKDEFGNVVCLICDDGYQKSCFNRKITKGARYITSNLVICEQHQNITSSSENTPENTLDFKNIIL